MSLLVQWLGFCIPVEEYAGGKTNTNLPVFSFAGRTVEKKKENSSHHYIIKNTGSNIRIKDNPSQGSWQPNMDICR